MKKSFITLILLLATTVFAVADVQPYDLDKATALTATRSGNDSYCELQSGTYAVRESMSFSCNGSTRPCIKVLENATVVLYIAKGATLSLEQRAYYYSNANYPSIVIPASSTLIIVGEGTLNAQGGTGSNGLSGADGKDMAGGRGGDGGPSSSPAIGNISGAGGSGGSGGTSNDDGNNRGTDGANGGNGQPMGKLYVLGPVTLNLTDGTFRTDSPHGGSYGDWHWRDDQFIIHNYYCDGSGAGGGAGGNGAKISYNIGGGGPGAGGGGGGGNGRHDYGNIMGNMNIWHGSNNNGNNGGQNVDGSHNPSGSQNTTGHGDAKVHNEAPHKGGSAGSYGDAGRFYHTYLHGNAKYQAAGTSAEKAISRADFAEEAQARALFSGAIIKTISFYDNTKDAKQHAVIRKNVFCFGLEWFLDKVDPVQLEGKNFIGFFDGEGNQIYDSEGKLITDTKKNPYLLLDGDNKCFGSHKDIELYPHWDVIKQIQARHIIASVTLPEGDAKEFDEDNGATVVREIIAVEIDEKESKTVTLVSGGINDNTKKQLQFTDATGDSRDVTVTVDINTSESQPQATFHYRYKKYNVKWQYTCAGGSGDIETEDVSTISNKTHYTKAGSVRYSSHLQAPLFANDRGYKFDHWKDNGVDHEGKSLPIAHMDEKDHVFTAVFVPCQYYIKTVVNNRTAYGKHGEIKGLDNDKLYDFNSKQTFEVIPEQAYEVAEVKMYHYNINMAGETGFARGEIITPDKDGKYTITVPNYDCYIEATYQPIEYKASFSTYGGSRYYFTVTKNDDPTVYTMNQTEYEWHYPGEAKDVSELTYNVEDVLLLRIFPNPAENKVNEVIVPNLAIYANNVSLPYETGIRLPNELTDYKTEHMYIISNLTERVDIHTGILWRNTKKISVYETTHQENAGGTTNIIPDHASHNNAEMKDKEALGAAPGEVVLISLPEKYNNIPVTAYFKNSDAYLTENINNFVDENGKSYCCFFMPDNDIDVIVGDRYADGRYYSPKNIYNRTLGFYSLQVPELAHYGTTVRYELSSLDEQIFPLTGLPVNISSSIDGKTITGKYDETTHKGEFLMPDGNVIVTAAIPEYQSTAKPMAKNSEYRMRLFSAPQSYLVPENVKVYTITGIQDADVKTCNVLNSADNLLTTEDGTDDYMVVRVQEDHNGFIPANTAVLLFSKEDNMNLIATSSLFMTPSKNILRPNAEERTVGQCLEDLRNEGGDYNAVYCLMQVNDGVALTLVDDMDDVIEAGTGFIPVYTEGSHITSDMGRLDRQLYITHGDFGGVNAIDTVFAESNIRPARKGTFTLSGQRIADYHSRLPRGIYIVDGKKLLQK